MQLRQQQQLQQPPLQQGLLQLQLLFLALVAVDLLVAVADLLVAVAVDLLVAVAVVMEDIDPEYINMDVSRDGLTLMYRSVCFHLEKWPGGDPREQEALVAIKDNLFRVILAQQFQ
jgi:hypothetical protein